MEKIPVYNFDNDFHDLDQKGEGSSGKIYTANSISLGKVALKIYFKKLDDNCLKEMKLLRELASPNIIQVFGLIKNQQGVYIGYVMKFMPFSLDNVIYDSKIEYGLDEIYSWSNQIARGLWALHKEKLLHRDVKPAKFVSKEYAAKSLSPLTKKEAMTLRVGTYLYMAPELDSDEHYDAATDVYSMSITIWEICHKKRPYFRAPGSNTDILAEQIHSQTSQGVRPPVVHYKDEPLTLLYQRGWETDPNNRAKVCEFLNVKRIDEPLLVEPEEQVDITNLSLPVVRSYLHKLEEHLTRLPRENYEIAIEEINKYIDEYSPNRFIIAEEAISVQVLQILILGPPSLTKANREKIHESVKKQLSKLHEDHWCNPSQISTALGEILILTETLRNFNDIQQKIEERRNAKKKTRIPEFPVIHHSRQLLPPTNKNIILIGNNEKYLKQLFADALNEFNRLSYYSNLIRWTDSYIIAENGESVTFHFSSFDKNKILTSLSKKNQEIGETHLICVFLYYDYDFDIFSPLKKSIPKENLAIIRVHDGQSVSKTEMNSSFPEGCCSYRAAFSKEDIANGWKATFGLKKKFLKNSEQKKLLIEKLISATKDAPELILFVN